MPKPIPPLVSRKAAHADGKRFFFTGEPCKHGHVALRYVSTGGCTGCMKRFERRLHPESHDKVPLDITKLWRSRRLDPEQLAALNTYVQKCIDTFEKAVLPPLCATCGGSRYVPKGDGTNHWKLCPDCPVDIK